MRFISPDYTARNLYTRILKACTVNFLWRVFGGLTRVFEEYGMKKSSYAVINFFTVSASIIMSVDEEEAPLYVDPNSLGEKEPVMPPLSLNFSAEEVTYTIAYLTKAS